VLTEQAAQREPVSEIPAETVESMNQDAVNSSGLNACQQGLQPWPIHCCAAVADIFKHRVCRQPSLGFCVCKEFEASLELCLA
jgi:hypothetical protein